MRISLDTIADSIALTAQERSRLNELEEIVGTHLEAFLTVGRALCEIRNRRLFRQEFATWEDYCTRKWGFGYSRANELIRSTEIAEGLLSGPAAPGGDAPLPPDLSPATLRPLQKLDPPLQSACWRLAARITEHPTHHVISQIVRTVQAAIHQGTNGSGSAKSTPPPSEKKVFLVSLHRLSESRVPAYLIVQGIDENKARTHLRACQDLVVRIHEIIQAIRQQFPEL
jgi:hypothetical protein